MDWLSLLIGVLIGWLLEWLFDVVFWRRKRRDSERVHGRLKEQLSRSQERIGELEAQVDRYAFRAKELEPFQNDAAGLRAGLEAARAHLAEIEVDSRRSAQAREALERQLETCRSSLAEREDELAGCATRIADIEAELAEMQGSAATEIPVRAPELPLLAPAGQPTAESAAAPDNLVRIEGIGPKIAQLLNEHSIWTFGQLAEAGVHGLRAILRGAGSRFRLADPASWPEQARLAAAGEWERLAELQQQLAAGRAID